MNVFNRIVIILGSFILLGAAGTVGTVLLGVKDPEQLFSAPWHKLLQVFVGLESEQWWMALGTCLGLAVIGVVLLVLECRPGPRPDKTLILTQDHAGHISTTMATIEALVDRVASQVPGVLATSTTAKSSRNGITVSCRVSVDASANIGDICPRMQARLKTVIEHFLGQPVAGVSVTATVLSKDHAKRLRRRVR